MPRFEPTRLRGKGFGHIVSPAKGFETMHTLMTVPDRRLGLPVVLQQRPIARAFREGNSREAFAFTRFERGAARAAPSKKQPTAPGGGREM